jgi:NAD(P) transhydrogenase subunit alpha
MDLVPRITRAQSMDALSSQANIAGYKAVLDAAEHFTRALPHDDDRRRHHPARQSVRDGRRRGRASGHCHREAFGGRRFCQRRAPRAKEQVKSLGGSFVAVEDDEFKAAEAAGGYAKEMSKDYQAKQAALVAEHISKQDIVITTALIPGRPARRNW